MSSTEKRANSSAFKAQFIGRTKHARELSGLTQDELARLLGIDQGTYKQYETRSLLPHWLIESFCMITRTSEIWLLSGRGRISR